MAKIAETQKNLSRHLVAGPKTVDQLQALTGLSFSVIEKDLKEMLKQKLVERDGSSNRYALAPAIRTELVRRAQIEQKDVHPWRIRAFIEIQAIDETILSKETEKFMQTMRNDKRFTIYKLESAPVEQKGEYHGTFVEINFSVKDFSSLMAFCVFYGPSAIEVIKPEQITIEANDLQDALVFLSDMVHKYTSVIAKQMNRQELENFHKSIYES